MESYYYLESGFDSKKLTIAQLTSILSKHNVKLPSTSQRKYVYVELFDKEIKAKASQMLAELNGVEPSDSGIQIISNVTNVSTDKAELVSQGKHSATRDDSPVRKRQRPTEQTTPVKLDTQSIKAPSLQRFFVSPSLPGIRSKIKSRVSELREFWDSQKPESSDSVHESDDKDDKRESLSELHMNAESVKEVEFKMIHVAQYLTLTITILVWLFICVFTKKGFFHLEIPTYFEMVSNLVSPTFYKVIGRSMMQMLAPSVFFSMDVISGKFESIMTLLSDLDPVLVYSVGGLCMIIAFGLKE